MILNYTMSVMNNHVSTGSEDANSSTPHIQQADNYQKKVPRLVLRKQHRLRYYKTSPTTGYVPKAHFPNTDLNHNPQIFDQTTLTFKHSEEYDPTPFEEINKQTGMNISTDAERVTDILVNHTKTTAKSILKNKGSPTNAPQLQSSDQI